MDSAKYIDILESSFYQMIQFCLTDEFYSEKMIQNINQKTLFAFILKNIKKIKLMKWLVYIIRFKSY